MGLSLLSYALVQTAQLARGVMRRVTTTGTSSKETVSASGSDEDNTNTNTNTNTRKTTNNHHQNNTSDSHHNSHTSDNTTIHPPTQPISFPSRRPRQNPASPNEGAGDQQEAVLSSAPPAAPSPLSSFVNGPPNMVTPYERTVRDGARMVRKKAVKRMVGRSKTAREKAVDEVVERIIGISVGKIFEAVDEIVNEKTVSEQTAVNQNTVSKDTLDHQAVPEKTTNNQTISQTVLQTVIQAVNDTVNHAIKTVNLAVKIANNKPTTTTTNTTTSTTSKKKKKTPEQRKAEVAAYVRRAKAAAAHTSWREAFYDAASGLLTVAAERAKEKKSGKYAKYFAHYGHRNYGWVQVAAAVVVPVVGDVDEVKVDMEELDKKTKKGVPRLVVTDVEGKEWTLKDENEYPPDPTASVEEVIFDEFRWRVWLGL